MNIANGINCKDTAEMYIVYCAEQAVEDMVEIATEICNEPQKLGRKYYALDYLMKVKGYLYVYERFLMTDDEELFEIIVQKTLEEKDSLLKMRLEELLREKPESFKYLYALIFLNSSAGFKQYVKITKEKMKPADDGKGLSDSATEMLAHHSNIDSLSDFDELRKTLFSEGFKDREFFGLHNGLYRAYCNLANEDYEKTKAQLFDAAKSKDISDEEKSFCNILLKDITQRQNAVQKERWDFSGIKSYLQNHRSS